MTGAETEREIYGLGQDAGRIEQRLEGHDDHLRRIDDSIHSLTRAVQGLTDDLHANVTLFSTNITSDRRDAEERERIAVTVAAALVEKATSVERGKANRWTAWRRSAAILGAVILVGNFALALYLTFYR
ncbi:hypothetical protein [Micromonospora sp. NPDC004704]